MSVSKLHHYPACIQNHQETPYPGLKLTYTNIRQVKQKHHKLYKEPRSEKGYISPVKDGSDDIDCIKLLGLCLSDGQTPDMDPAPASQS